MKFASYTAAGRASYGLVEGEWVADVGAVLAADYPDLRAVVAAGAYGAAQDAAARADRLPLSDVVLAPVIPNPAKIFCVGHNYETHRQETGRAKTDYPSIFTRFADSQIGHGQAITLPKVSTMLDFEGELAVVIGTGGRSIPVADALSHVAGYGCYNDASVRDWQWHTQQFTPGKNFPGTGAFGPWLVTADEVGDPAALSVTTRVNGQVVQSQPTADMIFPVATLIAYISTFTPLSPGDVIVSGTPGGVGAKRQPPLWLKDGDVVEVDIPGVGLLVNKVRAEAEG
ncbi:fumarylacetoacetate hydrolase family protein [Nitrospirillum viridazoti]|uniref:2-keto-4-pentenoate hydratase/2-oxohepta-3-ene-1,7-dioic acid hydratase in catechol pathway n=1 Tax=Nitrospirillum amazonense TaxID=28077 RepID=A0A560HIJ5_9PROT|nr:fumarylacetoacetate hydrolase family protein [Nitrospirillum amazonense]TWB46286.1 2-keto-4-pentenoate hydratase/2-oxohepta-3-ene-1,7-dioic acid hydratase in catechol pathway [Nitrospirillum amazonense]